MTKKIEINSIELEEITYQLNDLQGSVALLDSLADNPCACEYEHLNKALRLLAQNIEESTKNITNLITKEIK